MNTLNTKSLFATVLLTLLLTTYSINSLAVFNKAKRIEDISYGAHKANKLDVYYPKKAENAPIIFMVHGGAWKVGDKGNRKVYKNKVARWVKKGFIFVSVNYRLLPEATPLEQAYDVADALAYVQEHAKKWGGSNDKIILMGHSAGAHLVSLISTSRDITRKAGISPWLGTVAIDSAVFNVVSIMKAKHKKFYDQAFSSNRKYWRKASPYHTVSLSNQPLLAICSSIRKDNPCQQAENFKKKASDFNMRVEVLPVKYSHAKTNENLGLDNDYTKQVETFMKSLDPSITRLLQ